jgi:hypothetical protein
VHDATGCLEKEMKVDKEVEQIINKGDIGHNSSFFQSSKMQSLKHVLPRYQDLLAYLGSWEKMESPSNM